MSDVRYCEDCKWYGEATERCLRGVRSMVSRGDPLYRSAESMRDSDAYCGPDAKWFEPKEPGHV